MGYTDPHIHGEVAYYLTSQPSYWAGGSYFVHNVPRIVTYDRAFVTYEIKALNIYLYLLDAILNSNLHDVSERIDVIHPTANQMAVDTSFDERHGLRSETNI